MCRVASFPYAGWHIDSPQTASLFSRLFQDLAQPGEQLGGAEGLVGRVEGASKAVGTVAGTLHRSFNEAKKAGVAELKRHRV